MSYGPPRIQLSITVPEMRLMVQQAISKYQGDDLQRMIDDAVARALSDEGIAKEIEQQVYAELHETVRQLVRTAFGGLRWDERLAGELRKQIQNATARQKQKEVK